MKAWSQSVTRSTIRRPSHCPVSPKRATPIQRQISCNIQNDKKLCVNANIYSI